jgi:hypothetical protein
MRVRRHGYFLGNFWVSDGKALLAFGEGMLQWILVQCKPTFLLRAYASIQLTKKCIDI